MSENVSSDKQVTSASEISVNPPHGMKGVLKSEPFVNPVAVIGLGVFAVLSVLILMGFKYFLNKLKSHLRITDSPEGMPTVVGEPRLLALIDELALPRDIYVTENERLTDWARFSSTLSVILRRAVEMRTTLPLTERTTPEILSLLEGPGESLMEESKIEICDLLTRLDEITFAGRARDVHQASELVIRVRATVKSLIEAGVESAGPGASVSSEVKIFE